METAHVYLDDEKERQRIPLKGLIFDLDGTLLDTREIYFAVVEGVFERISLPPVSREVFVEAVAEGGFRWDMLLPDGAKAETGEILPRIRTIAAEISPSLFIQRNRMIPGAEDLLRRLSSVGIRLGVVTSTKTRFLDIKLRPITEAGLTEVFHTVIADDASLRPKPAPDPLLECARRMGIAPGDCAYVGDMRIDIRSGKSAGMLTVGVLSGFDTYATLSAEGADIILDSVASLQRILGLSPTSP
jgi:HAD superfamily hydrolase (TIGR01509 family)